MDRYGTAFTKLYYRLIPAADAIVAQTDHQRSMIENWFGISPTVIPNAYPIPPRKEILPQSDRKHVLWVGSSDPAQKKPERYLHLAQELPEIDFVMISQDIGQSEYHRNLAAQADSIPNLDFYENVSPDDVHQFYREATVLVNTSDYEGFPNTFLEAWRYETPVASLHFALDGILEDNRVGVHSGTMDTLLEDVASIHQTESRRAELGTNGRELVKQKYSLQHSADMYQSIIDSL